jgi:hypothetical protein
MAEATQLLLWTLIAFWLWLALTVVLRRLHIPLPHVSAAILGWVAAAALLPWAVPFAERWLDRWPDALHWLRTIL